MQPPRSPAYTTRDMAAVAFGVAILAGFAGLIAGLGFRDWQSQRTQPSYLLQPGDVVTAADAENWPAAVYHGGFLFDLDDLAKHARATDAQWVAEQVRRKDATQVPAGERVRIISERERQRDPATQRAVYEVRILSTGAAGYMTSANLRR
jgi:hypothetical protein